jgi:hypothetical protein
MIGDIQLITSIGASLATIIAAIVAVIGISAWKREHIGKRKAELAEEILILFYQAEDAIGHVRSPVSWAGEGDRGSTSVETSQEKELRDRANVVFVRLRQHTDLFSKMRASKYRLMALFGREAAKPFDDFDIVLRRIKVAARMLSHIWLRQGRPMPQAEFQKHLAEMEQYEKIFWEMSEPDEIREELARIIIAIEATCKPAILRNQLSGIKGIIETGRKAIEAAQQ